MSSFPPRLHNLPQPDAKDCALRLRQLWGYCATAGLCSSTNLFLLCYAVWEQLAGQLFQHKTLMSRTHKYVCI